MFDIQVRAKAKQNSQNNEGLRNISSKVALGGIIRLGTWKIANVLSKVRSSNVRTVYVKTYQCVMDRYIGWVCIDVNSKYTKGDEELVG